MLLNIKYIFKLFFFFFFFCLILLLQFSFRVVIFSNQNGFSRIDSKKNAKIKEEQFKIKINNIFKILDIPIMIFCAVEKDKFRKPCKGIWNTFLEKYNKVDISKLL